MTFWRVLVPLGVLAAATACSGKQPVAGGDPVAVGREVFRTQGCLKCHAVGGQGGQIGPDLSQVGSRLSPDLLRRYVTDPRSVRPDSKMPKHTLAAEELDRLVAYLASLK